MKSLYRTSLLLLLGSGLTLAACSDDVDGTESSNASGTATETGDGDGDGSETSDSQTTTSGDGDGDPATGDGDGDGMTGDGDGDGMTGDGDGDGMTGDGDGDGMTGDGDGDGMTGDGDGDGMTGDGDGDGMTGDGDGDMTGDGDGDMTGDGDGDEGVCTCDNMGCGECPEGPDPIDIGGYTIDSTEVTTTQYASFLDVDFPQEFFDALPAGCEFKSDFVPDNWLNPQDNLPVVNVDWCDAWAYCEWSGKELCGAIGGGPAELGDVGDFNASQWYRACTQGGIKEYPYGLLYQGQACNTVDAGINQLSEVGSLPGCEGGYPGIFDMSGNVWEWTNACNDEGECRRRGGSYFSSGPNSRCFVDSIREREFRNNNQGFRCCDTQ